MRLRPVTFALLAALCASPVAAQVTGGGGGGSQICGAPSAGNLAKWSTGSCVTNGDLTGDVSTSGSTATTIRTSIALPGSPTTTTQAAGDNSTKVSTTAYADTAVANGIAAVNPAVAVKAATTAAADTSGWTYANGASGIGATFTGPVNTVITIDGVTFTTVGQRLLVKNDTQSPSGAFNGIYSLTALHTVGTGDIYTRALDYDQPSDMNNSGLVPVVSGTANGTTFWLLTSSVATVGTDALAFTKFSTVATGFANPSATASDTAVNGSATTAMRSDAAPAVQKCSTSAFGLCKPDGTSIQVTGGVISTVIPSTAASIDLYSPPLSASFPTIINGASSSPIPSVSDVANLGMVLDASLPGNSIQLNGAFQSIAAGPWTVTARLRVTQLPGTWSGAGIAISDGTKYEFHGTTLNTGPLNSTIFYLTAANSYSTGDYNTTNWYTPPEYYRIVNDGTNLKYYVSWEGRDWILLLSQLVGAHLGTITKVGVAALMGGTATTHLYAACPYWNVSFP